MDYDIVYAKDNNVSFFIEEVDGKTVVIANFNKDIESEDKFFEMLEEWRTKNAPDLKVEDILICNTNGLEAGTYVIHGLDTDLVIDEEGQASFDRNKKSENKEDIDDGTIGSNENDKTI